MKKILYFFVALCLCLNSAGAFATEDADVQPEPVATVEAQAEPEKAPKDEGEVPATEQEAETPAPADEPDAEPTIAPEETSATKEPEESTGEEGEDAQDEPDATDAPGAETPEPTEAPSDDAPAEATEKPTPQEQDEPMPEDAEAWYKKEGKQVYGDLKDIVAQLNGDETVYIHADKLFKLEKAPLKLLSGVTFEPDEKVFRDGKYLLRISKDDPRDYEADDAPVEAQPEDAEAEIEEAEPVEAPEPVRELTFIDLKDFKDAEPDEVCDLYIWVEKQEPEAPEQPDEPETPSAIELTVVAEGYEGATWRNEMPVFTLSGIPEDKANWCYAVIIYDERIAMLSEDVYVPEAEGVYTVRFAMLDEIGDIVDASEKYTLWLDCTLPQVSCLPDESQGYTLNLTAEDGMSGVEAYSLDGGESWTALANGELVTYVAPQAQLLDAGTVLVRDAAGNVWRSDAPIALDKIEAFDGGWGGGGGGGGSAAPAKTHAKGEGEKAAAAEYDAVALEFPEEPMEKLTLGEEELELTLTLTAAQEPEAPVGQGAKFTAALASWTPELKFDVDGNPVAVEPKQDTLILTAEPEENLGDMFTYQWRFNGEVYRLLGNSGVKYLALKVGDDMAVFPTAGFTGGTKYTELKMLGVSTRKFDYTVDMKINLDPAYVSALTENDFSQTCDVAIRAEVENMAYELSASPQSVMYFYDVYVGPEAMLDAPYGEYKPEEQALGH